MMVIHKNTSKKVSTTLVAAFLLMRFFGTVVFASSANNEVFTNDPGFTTNPGDIDRQWGLAKIGFPDAWAKTTGSKENIVAVIDTGIDATHNDLSGINFLEGYDFLSKRAILPKTNSDDNGHGTLVAGILGATPDNNLGISGTNWQISIIPLKALDASGKGVVKDIAEAIIWAADHKAGFINLSIGGMGFSPDEELSKAVRYAYEKGVLIVAAAGNDSQAEGYSLDKQPVYPICEDNGKNMVLGVTALDSNDLKPGFANFGKNCIDVAAPGKRILSTINYDPLSKAVASNAYAYVSGSSLAVPFVVGQAALIKSLYPNFTNSQIRDRIISTAEPVDILNLSQCSGQKCEGLLGAGRVNVDKSLGQEFKKASELKEGDLVRTDDGKKVYQISGGKKRPIPQVVFEQKFSNIPLSVAGEQELKQFPTGPSLVLSEGTLFKLRHEPTVYMMSDGYKRPITGEVFTQRKLDFKLVKEVGLEEFEGWILGAMLPPNEGSLVRGSKNKTVYWVVNGLLHPVNSGYYKNAGLNIFSTMVFPDSQIEIFQKGEPYVR